MKSKEKVINYIKNQLIKDVIVLMLAFWMIMQGIFEADWSWKILVVDGIIFFLYTLPFYIKEAVEKKCSIWGVIFATAAIILLFSGMVALFINIPWAIKLIGAGIALSILCRILTPIEIKIK